MGRIVRNNGGGGGNSKGNIRESTHNRIRGGVHTIIRTSGRENGRRHSRTGIFRGWPGGPTRENLETVHSLVLFKKKCCFDISCGDSGFSYGKSPFLSLVRLSGYPWNSRLSLSCLWCLCRLSCLAPVAWARSLGSVSRWSSVSRWASVSRASFPLEGKPTDTQRLLIFVWIISLLVGEWLVFPIQLQRCANRILRNSPLKGTSQAIPEPVVPTSLYRLAIIADPQLTDAYSYKQSPGISLWLTQFYSDLYMRRAFAAMQASFDPQAILFLGDLMDGGREWVEQREETFVLPEGIKAPPHNLIVFVLNGSGSIGKCFDYGIQNTRKRTTWQVRSESRKGKLA